MRVFGKEKERRLLVVDSYKPHQSEGLTMAKERCNADVIIIPGGCTSIGICNSMVCCGIWD